MIARAAAVADHFGATEQVRVGDHEVRRQARGQRVLAATGVRVERVRQPCRLRVERASGLTNVVLVQSVVPVARRPVRVRRERPGEVRQVIGSGFVPVPGPQYAHEVVAPPPPGSDVRLQVRLREPELVEDAVLDEVQLVVVVGDPAPGPTACRRSAPRRRSRATACAASRPSRSASTAPGCSARTSGCRR